MSPYANVICDETYKLGGTWKNARWVVAVAIPESSMGVNAKNGCNAWGWGPHRYLGSDWETCIRTYIQASYNVYLSKDSIKAYLGKYCQSACTNWESLVTHAIVKMS